MILNFDGVVNLEFWEKNALTLAAQIPHDNNDIIKNNLLRLEEKKGE